MSTLKLLALLLASSAALAEQSAKPFDAASAFGARESITNLRLSPDGQSVTYLGPTVGQGSAAYTLSLARDSTPKMVLKVDGNPYRLESCNWVSKERLICSVHGVLSNGAIGLVNVSRLLAVNADGTNLRLLSTRQNDYSRGYQLFGGQIVDWLPDQNGAVLMARAYVPDEQPGTHLGSDKNGLGVDWIDTRTLKVKNIELPHPTAVEYLSDGQGNVRIMGSELNRTADVMSGVITFAYRKVGSREWLKLGDYNTLDGSGFSPRAVDPDLNIVYGFKKKDGRKALYSVALDGSMREELIYARPDVDVDGLIRIGRREHVVGTSYDTDVRKAVYFSPEIELLLRSFAKALPHAGILQIVDASVDENKLLVFSGSDSDPGVYYIYDRKTHELNTFLVARAELEGVKLAKVKFVAYPASDGVEIPGYLTLPPGTRSAKGLPAIVMPHGGPAARDSWGFDWLAQFYANRGFAVLQPNFRGSSGYGDAWFEQNGFKSWPIAIGDVLDGGRWLVKVGIADPSKLAIVGWSYGGYAALQSAATDPTVFKAVVAIAPVTDLAALKEEHRGWTDFELVSNFIGAGAQMNAGSPLENAAKIQVPVLLFHGARDANVSMSQSKRMAARLTGLGAKAELVTWENLDHQLDDSNARAEMLRKSDTFLRGAMGLAAMPF